MGLVVGKTGCYAFIGVDSSSRLHDSICPGQAFAESSIWLAAANIIATMDLTFAKDNLGRAIVPEAVFISGFVR